MNKIDANQELIPYLNPPEEEGLINEMLTNEIMVNILSYLNKGGMQFSALVCRQWKTNTIEAALRNVQQSRLRIMSLISPFISPDQNKKLIGMEIDKSNLKTIERSEQSFLNEAYSVENRFSSFEQLDKNLQLRIYKELTIRKLFQLKNE